MHNLKRSRKRSCARKKPYDTQADAKGAAKRASMRGLVRMQAYKCVCGKWHIGHAPNRRHK